MEKSKTTKKRSKKVQKLRAATAAALERDEFAKQKAASLSLRLGQFKTAPDRISGDVSNVAGQLAKQFDAFFAAMKSAPEDVVGIFDNAVGETFGMVQLRTPVDTGEARSSWVLQNLSPAQNDRQFRIGNSALHAQYLEYGWSRQAPAGMLRVSLLELEQRLARAMAAYANS